MIECEFFYDTLAGHGIDFFAGVPDSLLKDFCAYVTDHTTAKNHITASNEGGAVALACGHYLTSGRMGLVYMQNSGQGNAVNPLVSLADPDVYSIPLLLLIGWRGEPGKHDEPQHLKQGRVTLDLLETLDIPYRVLPGSPNEARLCVDEIVKLSQKTMGPVALVVKKGTFNSYQMQKSAGSNSDLSREEAIKAIVNNLTDNDIVVSTTGKISRELYEHREKIDGDHSRDFLTVGSMGHCCQIAMGIALSKQDRQVYCLDGDGSVIMHMGALAIIGTSKSSNFKHIVFNNGCHDSVGGQPTCGFEISILDIAKACGYPLVLQARTIKEIDTSIHDLKLADGPCMLEIIVSKGSRSDLGRPKSSPNENKKDFMRFLAD